MRRSQEEIDTHVEKTWEEFWLPLFEREIEAPIRVVRGIGRDKIVMLDARFVEQLKKELTDYHDIMSEASKVYCDVTGGIISKPNTMASAVIGVANERHEEWQRDAIKEWIEFAEVEFAGYQITEVIKSLKEHFNIVNEEN